MNDLRGAKDRSAGWRGLLSVLGLSSLVPTIGRADPTVQAVPMGPDGQSLGCAVSPKGLHVAVLAAKGSRFVVLLDGVEGPKIEGLLPGIYAAPVQLGSSWSGLVPILFSSDGSHSAYIGQQGDEYLVVEDGKEVGRGPIVPNGTANITVPLSLSSGGKHLFYMTKDGTGYHVVVDGQAGPPTGVPTPLVVSPDGAHYAYTGFGNGLGNGRSLWAVIDGHQVRPIGDDLQFTAKNTLVSTVPTADGFTELLFNGSPAAKAYGVHPLWFSPDGNEFAAVITPRSNAPSMLTVSGKPVPAADGLSVLNVFFSPDGKRYAALGATKTQSMVMVLDGKKGQVYQAIARDSKSGDAFQRWMWVNGAQATANDQTSMPVPGFTADSSKFVYVATQGGRQFLVTEEDESNAFASGPTLQPILSPAGNHITVFGTTPDGKQHLVFDGQDKEYGTPGSADPTPGRRYGLDFSPEGSSYAFVDGPRLNSNGTVLAGRVSGPRYIFSPDGKHLAYLGNDGSGTTLFLDGKIVDGPPSAGRVTRIFFSPDSQHLYTLRRQGFPGSKDRVALSVDGKVAVHYMEDNSFGGVNGGNFEFGAGACSLLSIGPTETCGFST